MSIDLTTLEPDILKIINDVKNALLRKASVVEIIELIVTDAVILVEDFTKVNGNLKGADKKDLAKQIIDSILDKVKIPAKLLGFLPVPRFLLNKFIHGFVGKLIDSIVARFNKMGIFKHSS